MEFQQQTIAPYKRSNDTLNVLSFTFMKKGLRQMKSHLIERMYGHHYSKQPVLKTQLVSEDVQDYHERS